MTTIPDPNPIAGPSSGRTLRPTWPFGRTLGLAALLLVLLAGAAEGLARVPAVQARLVLSSTNNPSVEFDTQLYRLEQYVARKGAADCLVIGNSMVNNALSVDTFEAAYRQAGGDDPPNCFKFTVNGMLAQQAGSLARLLTLLYHPRLIVYTVSPRDFTPNLESIGYTRETDPALSAWVRYRLGEAYSLEGWLIENSRAYRTAISFKRWLQTVPPGRFPLPPRNLTQAPDRVDEAELYALLADYQVSRAGLDGLAQIVALQAQGVRVVVVEMPLHPSYLLAFDDPVAAIDQFRTSVQQATTAAGAVFWSAEIELGPTLTTADFLDRNHLNDDGATVFSTWLAGKMAELP